MCSVIFLTNFEPLSFCFLQLSDATKSQYTTKIQKHDLIDWSTAWLCKTYIQITHKPRMVCSVLLIQLEMAFPLQYKLGANTFCLL